MICQRCETNLPDDTKTCPVCGLPFVRQISAKTRLLRWMLLLSPSLCYVLVCINTYLVLTAAHYPANTESGLFHAIRTMYAHFPVMKTVNLLALALLFGLGILATVSLYYLQKMHRRGLILLICTHTALLLWSAAYPVVSYLFTDHASPVLPFTVLTGAVYLILSAVTCVCLLRSGRFHY